MRERERETFNYDLLIQQKDQQLVELSVQCNDLQKRYEDLYNQYLMLSQNQNNNTNQKEVDILKQSINALKSTLLRTMELEKTERNEKN